MSQGWDTADYALIVSLFSACLALIGVGWNIWSTFIFPKPRLEVGVGYFVDGTPSADETNHMVNISVVNHGPNEATIKLIIGRKAKWHSLFTRRYDDFFIKHWGTRPPNLPAVNLPHKIEVGEEYIMNFQSDVPWFERPQKRMLGVVDTFGNQHWAKKRDLIRAGESQEKYSK